MSAYTANPNTDAPDIPWWGVLLGGAAAILVGLLLLLYPAATTFAIVQFFGIYWLLIGIVSIILIFVDRSKWGWKLIKGLLGITAGLIVLEYPLISTFMLPATIIVIVSIESIVMGVVALIQAFQGGGWGYGVLGVLVIVVGLVLLFNPFLAALGLPLVVGVLSVVLGILALFAAFQLRGLQHESEKASLARAAAVQPVDAREKSESAPPAGQAVAPAAALGAAATAGAAVAAAQAASDESPLVPEPEVSFAVPETTEDDLVAGAMPGDEAPDEGALFVPGTPEESAKFKEELTYVEGIGSVYAGKLKEAGITHLADLLNRGATRKGRQEISDTTGISGTLILKWVNHADLYRIKGVGSEYADLLEASGVDTVVELGTRNPDNLHAKMTEVNESKNLVRKMPAQAQVEEWVSLAKQLPRVVQY